MFYLDGSPTNLKLSDNLMMKEFWALAPEKVREYAEQAVKDTTAGHVGVAVGHHDDIGWFVVLKRNSTMYLAYSII